MGAPDNPARNLITSDQAHCDNGDHLHIADYPHSAEAAQQQLTSCQTWIFSNLDQAVGAAADLLNPAGGVRDSQIPTYVSCTYLGTPGRAKCNVLEALGLALHASQDFYSHTNWTDQKGEGAGTLSNPAGLGAEAPAPWLDPRANAPFPEGLISGCFVFLPETAFCPGRVRHEDLNKDKGEISLNSGVIGQGATPRARGNDNFKRAVSAAVADTQEKWNYFKARVLSQYGAQRGGQIICAITHDNPARTCR